MMPQNAAKAPGRRARLAVIGLGKMGIMHCSMIQACPSAELVGLVDRDPGLGRHVGSIVGAGIPAFASLAEVVKAASPDGVVIATPQFTHRNIIEEAWAAGLHVLTEKPLAHTLADADALKKAASTAGRDRLLHVGFMKGHDPLFRRAALLLDAAALDGLGGPAGAGPDRFDESHAVLGRVRGFQASVHLSQVFKPPKGWTFTKEKAGGGVLINTGIHLLFVLRMLFGPLRRVACLHTPIHADTEDTVSALVEHTTTSGERVAGSVHVSWSTGGYETEGTQIVAEGTKGSLWVEDQLIRAYLTGGAGGLAKGWHQFTRAELEATDGVPAADFNMSPEYAGIGYYREIERFAQAILGRPGAWGFGLEVGLELQRVVDAYYRSAAADGAWVEPSQG